MLRTERCQQKLLAPVGIWPPVTLLEISTFLKHRGFHNIEIIDGEAEEFSFAELVCEAANKQPDMVIIQAATPTIEDDILFSGEIKRQSKNTSIVLIGVHATAFAEGLLSDPAVDYVVLGEPEQVIAELADYCFKNQGDISNIRGLGYKNNGDVLVNEKGLPRDDYDYPSVPERSLLKNDRYIMPLTGKPFTVIKVSRGAIFPACSAHQGCIMGRDGGRGARRTS